MSDAIDRYVQESNKQIGRTKTQVLKSVKTFDIADKHCDAMGSAEIVKFPLSLASKKMRRNILGSDIFQNALLFGIPITAVVSAIFFGTNNYRILQIDNLIRTELEVITRALVSEYESEGEDALIKGHIERDGEVIWSELTAFRYLTFRDTVLGLFDDNGDLIAGYPEFFGFEDYDISGFYIGDVYFEIAVVTTHFQNGHKIGIGLTCPPRLPHS